MENIALIAPNTQNGQISVKNLTAPAAGKQNRLSSLERELVYLAITLRIFFLAIITLRSFKTIKKAYNSLLRLRKATWNGQIKKIHKVDGKYYFNLYTPGWPSTAYDQTIKSELLRYAAPTQIGGDKLRFIFFAITRKCPLNCEHCFEWDNLNKKETFTLDELKQVVSLYQAQGVNQIQFSGGEPLVRFKDLVEVIRFASSSCECYIITSGFNLTQKNALLLKDAGCKGIIISIDHYMPHLHNNFRGDQGIFDTAVAGVKAAIDAGMVTAVSICVTGDFIDGGHLLPYLEFAQELGVHFVQILEPKDIGRYAGKSVLLEERHIQQLEDFFKIMNHSPAYKDFPTLMYHGYHQRRVGCYAGSRSLYIDSAGNVNACPFCHTHSYNIRNILDSAQKVLPVKENLCPRYEDIA